MVITVISWALERAGNISIQRTGAISKQRHTNRLPRVTYSMASSGPPCHTITKPVFSGDSGCIRRSQPAGSKTQSRATNDPASAAAYQALSERPRCPWPAVVRPDRIATHLPFSAPILAQISPPPSAGGGLHTPVVG